MKKYTELEIELVLLQRQDVVTMSGFGGEPDDDGFGDPNTNTVGDF